MAKSPTRVPVSLVFFIGIIGISFSAIFVRWSSAPVSVIGMYRLLFTNLLMLPLLLRHWPEIRRMKTGDWLKLTASGCALAFHFLFWMGSLRYTTVASSTVLLTLEPIFVAVGGYYLLRERLSSKALLGMLIAILGAATVGAGDIRLSGQALYGDFLSFIGAFAVAIHMLLGKPLRQRISSYVYSFVVFFAACCVFAVYNAVAGIRMTGYGWKETGIFMLLAVVPTLCGHVLFNWLLKYMQTAAVSMSVLGEPAGASLLAYFLLGEKLAAVQYAASAMMLLGVWLFLRSQKHES